MATTPQLPDRKYETIVLAIVTSFFSTIIALWRLVVRYRINPRLGWSDYWMMVALPLSITGHIFNIIGAYAGEGRLDADPFLSPDQAIKVRKWIFVAGALNIYAMFFAKMSICSYLLALNFSQAYRIVIHISTYFVVVNLLLLPLVSHWANCNPPSKRWDNRIPGRCWSTTFPVAVISMQGAVNVITDLIYAAAPILYLRQVTMTRYTRWGVRCVFLCALLGSAISIAKVVAFARILQNPGKDAIYQSSTVSQLSLSENSVTIIIACLPPLRRTYDKILLRILPQRLRDLVGGGPPPQNFALSSYYSVEGIRPGQRPHGDGESTMAIIPESDEYVEDANGKITKTKRVVMQLAKNTSTAEFGSDGQDAKAGNHNQSRMDFGRYHP